MTAKERIDALIARAGAPVLKVKNSEIGRSASRRIAILMEADKEYDGSLVDMIADLVDTVDRMEAALSNALNEKEALLEAHGRGRG